MSVDCLMILIGFWNPTCFIFRSMSQPAPHFAEWATGRRRRGVAVTRCRRSPYPAAWSGCREDLVPDRRPYRSYLIFELEIHIFYFYGGLPASSWRFFGTHRGFGFDIFLNDVASSFWCRLGTLFLSILAPTWPRLGSHVGSKIHEISASRAFQNVFFFFFIIIC